VTNPVRLEPMSNDEALKFYNRAIIQAKMLGFKRARYDIAQDVLIKFIKNPDSKQTVEQAAIDVVRHRFGRTKDNKTGKMNKVVKRKRAIELAYLELKEALDIEFRGVNPDESIDGSFISSLVQKKHRKVMHDYFYLGMNFREIGEKHNMTSAWAFFNLNECIKYLRVKVKKICPTYTFKRKDL
jgi:hypothetical protein